MISFTEGFLEVAPLVRELLDLAGVGFHLGRGLTAHAGVDLLEDVGQALGFGARLVDADAELLERREGLVVRLHDHLHRLLEVDAETGGEVRGGLDRPFHLRGQHAELRRHRLEGDDLVVLVDGRALHLIRERRERLAVALGGDAVRPHRRLEALLRGFGFGRGLRRSPSGTRRCRR